MGKEELFVEPPIVVAVDYPLCGPLNWGCRQAPETG